MNCFRRIASYTFFAHKMNEDILEEVKLELVDQKLRRCKSNWLRHIKRINKKKKRCQRQCLNIDQIGDDNWGDL
jgi:hypothetical protein